MHQHGAVSNRGDEFARNNHIRREVTRNAMMANFGEASLVEDKDIFNASFEDSGDANGERQ